MTDYRTFATLENQTFVAVGRSSDTTVRFLGEEHYPDAHGIIRVYGSGNLELPYGSFWDLVTIVDGEYYGKPFSGDTPGATWLGDPDESESQLDRHSPIYRITDAITTDDEPFKCVVHTRIMSFEMPQKYKRLFWWGIDGIFRLDVRGTVVPVIYGHSVTWGQLLSQGSTWGALLPTTWGSPGATSNVVETMRPDVGATAQRKFARFRKKLRFRQLQFRIEFNTRGDTLTAPTRLFSVHAEVTAAQTVSKAIS